MAPAGVTDSIALFPEKVPRCCGVAASAAVSQSCAESKDLCRRFGRPKFVFVILRIACSLRGDACCGGAPKHSPTPTRPCALCSPAPHTSLSRPCRAVPGTCAESARCQSPAPCRLPSPRMPAPWRYNSGDFAERAPRQSNTIAPLLSLFFSVFFSLAIKAKRELRSARRCEMHGDVCAR